MKFNVCYNQQELLAYNKSNPGKEIDFIDAILLQEFLHLMTTWPDIKTKMIEGKRFYNIGYSKILTELPTLNLKDSGLRKRIQLKFIKTKLVYRYIDRKEKSYVYWRLSKEAIRIATPGNTNDSTPTKIREPLRLKEESHSDHSKTNNKPTYNKSKDKRELSALFYFEKYNSESYKDFFRRYGKDMKNFKKFTLDFNDTVGEKNIDFDKPDLKRFLFAYAKGWVKNQDKYDRIEKKDTSNFNSPEFRKIS